MILPDINLLIYAQNTDSYLYERANAWWQNCLNGTEVVLLPHEVIFGFIRISTNPRLGEQSISMESAKSAIDQWLSLDHVRLTQPDAQHYERTLSLLQDSNSRGKLTSDAILASYAIANKAILYSYDQDFARFPNLSWKNPLI